MALTALSLLCIGVMSCSKDEHKPAIGEGSFSMEVNGQLWEANLAGVSTFDAAEFDDDDELHGAMITGAVGELGEANYESMILVLGLSEARLHQANGSYPFVLDDDDFIDGRATGLYTQHHGDGAFYVMTTGQVTITSSSVSEQTFMGMSIGRGFDYVTGTFEGTLQLATDGDPPAGTPQTLTIRNGKFNAPSTSGLANLPGF